MNTLSYTILLIVVGFMLTSGSIFAQEEPVGFDDWIDPEALERGEEIDFGSDFEGNYSLGWFPKPYAQRTWLITFAGANVFDRAHNIRSGGFHNTTNGFSHRNPYPNGGFLRGRSFERQFVLPFSQDTDDDARSYFFHEEGIEIFSTYQLSFGLPFIVDITTGVQILNNILYSPDRSREFLSLTGVPRGFTEVGNAVLLQRNFVLGAGVLLPIYGAFLDIEDMRMASFYYIKGEVLGVYTVSHRFDQYAQIMDAKEDLRYANGRDTVTFFHNSELETLRLFRPNIGIAIGWQVHLDSFAAQFELFGRGSMFSIITDDNWRQYQWGLRVAMGWRDK